MLLMKFRYKNVREIENIIIMLRRNVIVNAAMTLMFFLHEKIYTSLERFNDVSRII